MKKPGILSLRRIGTAITAMAALAGGLAAPAPTAADSTIAYVSYLRVLDTDQCLAYSGTEVALATCGSDGTKWRFNQVTNADYRLQTYDGFQCLEAAYTDVYLHGCGDWPARPAMKWHIVAAAGRSWASISNYETGRYLHADYEGGVHMTGGQNVDVTDWEWVPAGGLEVRGPGMQADVVGTAISPVSHTTADGKSPYTWTATGLPPGLSIKATTGTISGTPTEVGSFTVRVTVNDSTNPKRSGSTSYDWTVVPVPEPGCSGANGTDIPITAMTESYIAIDGCGGNASTTATVTVDIVHPRISDLEVWLVSASGRAIALHYRTASGLPDIHKTFTENLSFSVADGTWKLRARDLVTGSEGRIDGWSLRL
ncbi:MULTISPECIES: putative Ig domain-containing protein [Nonomuraea]|uniref:putative Ig domain-containing protein n=1 Tax=Nonomuraea TaxID=83681 RepID=UPI0029AC780C|nr:putative Ig domain-containing protein [Nonomuraea angiospora]MDX3101463.1 putative Ig domain-containing protein [Nonomuraea angiospora]